MGIEDDIKTIKVLLNEHLGVDIKEMKDAIKDLNEKVDLLTIRKQVDRQDKEKRLYRKHTVKG